MTSEATATQLDPGFLWPRLQGRFRLSLTGTWACTVSIPIPVPESTFQLQARNFQRIQGLSHVRDARIEF